MPEQIPNLVSTIIPIYNRPNFLREAVASVLAQTHRPIEIILSDDGSDQAAVLTLAEQLVAENPAIIQLIRNPNRGPGPAREAGRQIARGEFIQYLDSDDRLAPEKFALQIAALRTQPECGVAYGHTRLIDQDGNVLQPVFKWTGQAITQLFPKLLVDRWWCTHTPLYRRTVCDAIGGWSDLRWSQDWEYDARIGARNIPLAFCGTWVSDHRQHQHLRQIAPANWHTPARAAARQRLLGLLWQHAKTAGLTPENPEVQHLSRWLFYCARQCGIAGLSTAAKTSFEWAKEAAGVGRANGWDFKLYALLARGVGWRVSAHIVNIMTKFRPQRAGQQTLKQAWMEAQ